MSKICMMLVVILPLVAAVGNGPRKAQRARINNMRSPDPDSVVFPDHHLKSRGPEDQVRSIIFIAFVQVVDSHYVPILLKELCD